MVFPVAPDAGPAGAKDRFVAFAVQKAHIAGATAAISGADALSRPAARSTLIPT